MNSVTGYGIQDFVSEITKSAELYNALTTSADLMAAFESAQGIAVTDPSTNSIFRAVLAGIVNSRGYDLAYYLDNALTEYNLTTDIVGTTKENTAQAGTQNISPSTATAAYTTNTDCEGMISVNSRKAEISSQIKESGAQLTGTNAYVGAKGKTLAITP
jgi:hypothetical protein